MCRNRADRLGFPREMVAYQRGIVMYLEGIMHASMLLGLHLSTYQGRSRETFAKKMSSGSGEEFSANVIFMVTARSHRTRRIQNVLDEANVQKNELVGHESN